MKNTIISNFHPILVGKLFDQEKLNQYTKFLYYHYHNHPVLVGEGNRFEKEPLFFEEVSEHVDKYAVSPNNIAKRQVLIFDEIERFIENDMEYTDPSDYILPVGFKDLQEGLYGPKIGVRMDWYKKKLKYVFDKFYEHSPNRPENIIHVTCSGYSSPSLAQQAVIERKWEDVSVTHSYHMGCYGAFPAIRTGSALLGCSEKRGRVDIVHTELLSSHLNLTEFSPANTVICSLFADGFIGYSLYDETSFFNDDSIKSKVGLKILASHEVIIPDSLEDMTWDLGEYNFLMTLSKRVPIFIKKSIEKFITDMCNKIDLNFKEQKDSIYYAIHPGGPKIIDHIVNELEIDPKQAHWSYEVLKNNGNMSSAAVPHVFNEIVNDSNIKPNTKIIAIAFGPGLTATGLVLEKVA